MVSLTVKSKELIERVAGLGSSLPFWSQSSLGLV